MAGKFFDPVEKSQFRLRQALPGELKAESPRLKAALPATGRRGLRHSAFNAPLSTKRADARRAVQRQRNGAMVAVSKLAWRRAASATWRWAESSAMTSSTSRSFT